MFNWFKRLLRRKRGPQPLTPGVYRLEAFVKVDGGDWHKRSETVTVADDSTYAHELTRRFFQMTDHIARSICLDDLVLRKDEELI